MAMTYDQAMGQFEELFVDSSPGRTVSGITRIYDSGAYPVEAYRIFKTLEAANVVVGGDSGVYDIYPGAIISVIEDGSNNGMYQVLYNNPSAGTLKLDKIYDASTVDSLVGGSLNVHAISRRDANQNPLIYFTGVNSSTAEQTNVTDMYFTDTICYDASGNVYTPGSLLQSSDIRLKDDIKPLDIDLDSIASIDKISYIWKNSAKDIRNIGVSAQSVEAVYPELVYENPANGYKVVNYQGLAVLALAAVDKLYDRIKNLEEKVENLQK